MLQKHRLSLASQNTYKINHQFNCSEKYFVYFFTCDKCLKEYVGQTIDEFRRPCNSYKSNEEELQRLKPCMQEHLSSNFQWHATTGFWAMFV